VLLSTVRFGRFVLSEEANRRYSLFRQINSLFGRKNSLFNFQGIRLQHIEINLLNAENPKTGQNITNSLLFPVLREFESREWG
jgi:hypothetical protein